MSSSLKKGDAQSLPDYADQDYMILDLSPPPQLALSVRGLCKTYKIAQSIDDHVTAAEALAAWVLKGFKGGRYQDFKAIHDVSFDLFAGDVMAILGNNGSGKSTLLKQISRITEPTNGKIDLYGRVGSLLEVGSGFHPELTGRENIYLNGTILGMSNREIDREFDAIVEFAGVEKFLDTPIKRYSSGMSVRLAFAVAAHLRSEILIIDEVLSVGDQDFQKQCLERMRTLAQDGRAVLFVSHHLESCRELCNKALVLNEGSIDFMGDIEAGLEYYADLQQVNDIGLLKRSQAAR